MKLWQAFATGVVKGLLSSATAPTPTPTQFGREPGRIRRFCRELGWSIDEEEGDRIYLHFNEKSTGTLRKVIIVGGDDVVVNFIVASSAVVPADRAPRELLAHLLKPTSRLGSWTIQVSKDDDVTFLFAYDALGPGLHPKIFKYICEGLVSEVGQFEAKLRAARLM